MTLSVCILSDKNVDDTCNVRMKSRGKTAKVNPVRGEKVTVIAQENFRLTLSTLQHL